MMTSSKKRRDLEILLENVNYRVQITLKQSASLSCVSTNRTREQRTAKKE